MYNYNPYNRQYNFDFYNQMQPQNQIHTINQTPTQVQCYFVSNESDMEKVQMNYGIVYVGINKDKNEVYLRQINNNGLIDSNKYGLISESQEKNEFSKIMERLDRMENNFLTRGGTNADHSTNGSINGSNVDAKQNTESSINATI